MSSRWRDAPGDERPIAALNGERYGGAMAHGTGTGHVSAHPENEKVVVEYNEVFDEYSIETPGGASRQLISQQTYPQSQNF